MSWNPDSGTELTSAAISVTDVESTSMALWYEFLSGWLDGNGHVLAGAYVSFPALAGVSFQSMALPSKLEGLYLTVLASRASSAAKRLYGDGKWMIGERCRLDFYFRSTVKTARVDGHTSESLVRLASDRTFAVLSNHIACQQLTYRGIGVIRPQPPVVVNGGVIPMRLVSALATYTYPENEVATTVIVGANPRTYQFNGGYLQLWNPDTELYHTVVAVGDPVQYGIYPEGDEAITSGQAHASPTFRFKSGKQLQLWNPDMNKWHSAYPDGEPYPMLNLDRYGEGAGSDPLSATVAKSYRFKDGVGLQLLNATTNLWHTFTISGNPPTFTITQTGEA